MLKLHLNINMRRSILLATHLLIEDKKHNSDTNAPMLIMVEHGNDHVSTSSNKCKHKKFTKGKSTKKSGCWECEKPRHHNMDF